MKDVGPKLSRPVVLIVDDTEANLVALEALLGNVDCEVKRAASGNEALRLLLRYKPALVLLDVQMPEMDGYEVARHARSNPATREVPIIFVTAASESIQRELQGYGSGAVDYLFKPVNPYILRSKVRVFIELYLSRQVLDEEVRAHKKTQQVLEDSNRALRHFTHAASHDLGAPLRAITGFLQALDEDAGASLGAEARSFLQRALDGSVRLRALLDSLLVFAGLRSEAPAHPVDCNGVVAQVCEDLAERIEAAGATIEVEPLLGVTGDRGRIYQLFLNLIGNAIKYHRPGQAPRARVYCERRGTELTFCIQDDGIGVAPEHHERIFEAFQRLHSHQTYAGTGLGLAICRQIVEQRGGKIWVESEPGGGARFCFHLPSVS
jgi:signal transduction histidine kinase